MAGRTTAETAARTPRGPLGRVRSLLRALPRRLGYELGPRLMSELRRRWVLLRHPGADIRFGSDVYLGPGFSLHMPGGGSLIVGSGVEFRRGFRAEIYRGGRVVIGAGSYLTYDVIIACSTSIEIGERCGLGQCTFVSDGNHRYRDIDVPFMEQGFDYRSVRIADDVQIHSKCTITADIGERAVIGANAVVTKPIPAYSLAGGVPARVIDYFGRDEQREQAASER